MCQHSFTKKLGEEIEYKKRKPFRIIKKYECIKCGAKIIKKGMKLEEHYQQLDLNTNKVI